MKRRFLLITVGALLLLPAPASAGFDDACASETSQARVSLSGSGVSFEDGSLEFAGSVRCDGASSIRINSLVLSRQAATVASAPSASCSPCSGTVTTRGESTSPTLPGVYMVTMRFTVTVGGETFAETRTGTWAYFPPSVLIRAT